MEAGGNNSPVPLWSNRYDIWKEIWKEGAFWFLELFSSLEGTLAYCLQGKSRIIMIWKQRSTRNKEKVL